MIQDIRYALRAISKSAAMTTALVVSLGVGVGANAAVFNFISALLLRPPAGIAATSTLAIVRATRSSAADPGLATHGDVAALRASGAFDAVAAYDDRIVTNVVAGGELRRVRVAAVTGDLFMTLGMAAGQGRLITDADRRGAVISHRLWTSLGKPADILTRTVTIDRIDHAIVGIAPDGFRGMHPDRGTDVWRLLDEPANDEERVARTLSVLARTRDRDASEARLGGRFSVKPYAFMESDRAADTALLGAVLTGATLLVLVCACVNAASLLLSRGNARRRDLAVKLALGAGRGTLLRQLLIESGIVGIAGGCVGLLFAYWTTTIIPSLFAPEHAEMLDAGLSPAIVITTLAGSTLLGIALGVLPAVYDTAPVSALDLRGDAGTIAQTGMASRLQTGLVVAQIALSTVLLVSALLLTRSLDEALAGDLGDSARRIAVATISEPPLSFNPYRGQRAYAQILEQMKTAAGVGRAGFAAVLPIGSANTRTFSVEAAPGVLESVDAETNIISSGYFETMQVELAQGRGFNAGDGGLAPPVAVINDVAMHRFFGGSAIGRHLVDTRGDRIAVVGIVTSGRYRTMQESPAPMVYRPVTQEYVPRMYLVMRVRGEPGPAFYGAVRPALLAPGMELRRVASLREHFDEALVIDRLVTTLVTACGLMALLLAITGAYSLMQDSVRRRTREIGLRMALGASAMRIGRSIAAFGALLTAAGVAAGVAIVLAAEQVARMLVLGLPRADVPTMAVTAIGLLVVVLLAAVLPILRAVRVNPTIALRHT